MRVIPLVLNCGSLHLLASLARAALIVFVRHSRRWDSAEVEEVATGADLCTVQEAKTLSRSPRSFLYGNKLLPLPGLQWLKRAPRHADAISMAPPMV